MFESIKKFINGIVYNRSFTHSMSLEELIILDKLIKDKVYDFDSDTNISVNYIIDKPLPQYVIDMIDEGMNDTKIKSDKQ